MPSSAKPLTSGTTGRPAGRMRFLKWATAFLLWMATASPSAGADWAGLVERLADDGFDRPTVEALFARPEVTFEAGRDGRETQGPDPQPLGRYRAGRREASNRHPPGYLQIGIISRALPISARTPRSSTRSPPSTTSPERSSSRSS